MRRETPGRRAARAPSEPDRIRLPKPTLRGVVSLSKLGIEVFEVVPPAVDTELNPEGRGGFKAGLTPEESAAAAMKGLADDVLEIGYGMTEGILKASRAELDTAFQRMNSRW